MTARPFMPRADAPPRPYDRAPEHDRMIDTRDVTVAMRDGVELSVDVYRPDALGRFPALLAFSIYNKDLLGPDVAASIAPQPAWSPLWAGLLEAGDTRFFVSRGYVHIIGSPRSVGSWMTVKPASSSVRTAATASVATGHFLLAGLPLGSTPAVSPT